MNLQFSEHWSIVTLKHVVYMYMYMYVYVCACHEVMKECYIIIILQSGCMNMFFQFIA